MPVENSIEQKSSMGDFDEYIKQGEPEKKEKGYIWQTAIGLQQVDGLRPSRYLIETAKQNIEGDITLDEVKKRIDSYYNTNTVRDSGDRTEEADKVSTQIAEILSEKTFNFSPAEYITIHRRLFKDIYEFAGKIRNYNIIKSEWVLNGETVYYTSANSIRATLNYDFEQEKQFNYRGLSLSQIVKHITVFVSGLWQIHAFGEGNTRTTAVFTIKYLRTFGYKVNNDLFSRHSLYFRNALVRANYNDFKNNIHATNVYLERFFGNLLLGENNELKNRELHIDFEMSENIPNKLEVNFTVNKEKFPANDEKLLVNDDKFPVNNELFPVIGKKFLIDNKKFPIIGLEIIKFMVNNSKITIIELSKQLNISDRAVKNNINKLRNAGIISRVGSDKNGSWKILK